MRGSVWLGVLLGTMLAGCAGNVGRAWGPGEWPAYARDPGGMRHSPLTQVNRDNVGQLELAWTYRTGELATYGGTSLATKAAFEATPIMVDGILYLSTPTSRVIALDAATGTSRWVYDPKLDLTLNYSEVTSRGVALWTDSGKRPGELGYRLIYVGTIDGRLIALDAVTGQPREAFGERGIIDLKVGTGAVRDGQYQVTSPPAVIGDLVIVGNALGDNRAVEMPRGIVRAYDARSGALKWSWDPIPRQPGDPGFDTWQGELAHKTGGANAWPPISVDAERDLVFLPTTSPSPDYYGGERKGHNLYANCVVALRASTGKLVWAFQTVHHDLWDYDTPMQPLLFTLDRDGRSAPAVAIGTKSGHIFVLHRDTGAPLLPIEERAVPQTDVPGEETSRTQPFPANLPVFGLRSVTPDDAWGLTPAEVETGRKRIAELRYEGPFTPVSLRGTIEAPSNTGGFNWGGLSYDPARGIIVGAVNRFAAIVKLFPRASAPSSTGPNIRLEAEVGAMLQTPYVVTRTYLLNFGRGGIPYTKPPWGTLAAVSLRTGALQFEVPLGFMLDPKAYPEADQWGSISLGGPTTTAGGLVFIGATRDNHLRAFDIETGRLLWKALLPAGAQATPMTYEVGGTQYVLIAAGGHGKLGAILGDYVMAFALPRGRK
ncbi:MAG TPA: pyrroloquinoline quinone-dependent dehydrogenase [Terriglobales bacterium]|nr:pyrroloquinoline quinone-dependent dehydrogenase [Terriglobales bacterium]